MYAVTLVTQTRILSDHADEFARWQQRVNDLLTRFPGYLDYTLIPPNPPVQTDWVVIQRFEAVEAARAWLQSEQRQQLLDAIRPFLVGQDDIHLFTNDTSRATEASVSALISTRVKPGQQDAFLSWHQRVAQAQARFAGFQGYKLEPPIPGVQDDWVTILSFDSDSTLEAWLNSEPRKQLYLESATFSVESRIRKVRNGFESWFTSTRNARQGPPPGWKMDMLVLLTLYPTVFLLSFWVLTPQLQARGVPIWLVLFLGNMASTILLGRFFVPWASRLFNWWLYPAQPAQPGSGCVTWAGAGLVVCLYALFLLVFSRFP